MKRAGFLKISMIATIAVAFCLPLFAWKLGGKEMVFNGSGTRTKFGMTVYSASLYVPQELKGAGDQQILDADQPMSIQINITSGLITKDKFVDTVSEAFDTVAKSGYRVDKAVYMNLYNNVTIKKGDTFSNHYDPAKGITVVHSTGGNNTTLGIVKGLAYKKAFWAIYIGPKPVQKSLKKGMLGQ